MNISEWAARHNIGPVALRELQTVLSAPAAITENLTFRGSEASGQQRIRLQAPTHGVRLWRNNVGACMDERGNRIRYGLANESAAMNKSLKSSDLIGITPLIVKPEHIGDTLGIFTAIECKRPGWVYKGTPREVGQLSWCQLVISMGGFAQFATGPEDIWND